MRYLRTALFPRPSYLETPAAPERLLFRSMEGVCRGMDKRLPILGGALAGLLAAYMTVIATRWLRVTSLRVGLPALRPAWHGLRIALLTDFHAGGKRVPLPMLRQAKAQALAFEPDLIVLGGDFFDEGRRVNVGDLFTSWPSNIPVVAVIGNHDYRGESGDLSTLLDELERAGVRVLRNDAVSLDLRGQAAWIAGVDDPHTRRDDVSGALGCIPAGEFALLMAAHSPSSAVDLPAGRVGLLLSGHTHGGQVRLLPSGRIPFIQQVRWLKGLRPQPPLPYVRGQHWHRGTVVVISDGLGQSTIGARFRTRPEVILLELDQAPLSGPACDDAARYVTYQGNEPRLLRWLT